CFHRQFAFEVPVRYRRHDASNTAHLVSQVRGHRVHVVSQVFPGSGDPAYIGLATELSFSSYFAGHDRPFRSERIQLVHHRVDGVLQFENFTLNVHGDLLRKISVRDGGGNFSDVTHLTREVAGHKVHVISQVLPGSGDAHYLRLSAEASFGAYLARHTGDYRSERAELVQHRIGHVLKFEII